MEEWIAPRWVAKKFDPWFAWLVQVENINKLFKLSETASDEDFKDANWSILKDHLESLL